MWVVATILDSIEQIHNLQEIPCSIYFESM